MADDVSPEVAAHLASMEPSGLTTGFTSAANAPVPPSGALNFPLDASPEVIKHLQEMPSETPADLLTPPTPQHLPADKEQPDPYADMSDYMFMPSLRPYRSPLVDFGLISSDRDSFEAVLKHSLPGVKIKHDNGNLVITDPMDKENKYVFRTGRPQLGDFARAAAGFVPSTAIGVGAGAAGTALGAPTLLALLGTGIANHMFGAAREAKGGAPASYLEDLGAMALHGFIHGTGKSLSTLGNFIASRGSVAPGIAAGAETAALPPGAALPIGSEIPTQRPEVPAPPPAPPPGPPQEPIPPKYSPKDASAGLVPPEPPPEPPIRPPSGTPALQQEGEDIVRQIGAQDRGTVNKNFRERTVQYLKGWRDRVKAGFSGVDQQMAGQDIRAQNTLSTIADLEGEGELPAWVKTLKNKLTPQEVEDAPTKWPKYSFFDKERKDIGRMSRAAGGLTPDAKTDQNLAKKLYESMIKDQLENIEAKDPELAKSFTAAQQDAQNLADYRKRVVQKFGKVAGEAIDKDTGERTLRPLERDVTGQVDRSLGALSKGSPAELDSTLAAVPPELRSDVLKSAVTNKFGDVAAGENFALDKYAKWMKGVLANPDAERSLKQNLEPKAFQEMKDLLGVHDRLQVLTTKEAEDWAEKSTAHEAAMSEYDQAKKTFEAEKAFNKQRIGEQREATAAERTRIQKANADVKNAWTKAQAAAEKARKAASAVARKAKADPIGVAIDAASFFGGPKAVAARLAYRVWKSGVLRDAVKSAPFQRLSAAYNIPQGELAKRLQMGATSLAVGSPLFSGDQANPAPKGSGTP